MAFSLDRYKTHDGPRGNPDEWKRMAEAMVMRPDTAKLLAVLGLTDMPDTMVALQKARRNAMVKSHPDKNLGSATANADSASINEAFTYLSKNFAPADTASKIATVGADGRLVHPPACNWDLPLNLDDPNLIADLKIDGERMEMYLNTNPYTEEKTTTLLSKYLSPITKQYGNRSVPSINCDYPGMNGTILDGELFQGRFYAFDIPFYKGKDIRKLPLRQRRETLKKAILEMGNPLVRLITSWTKDFGRIFQTVVGAGGEGLVIKDLRAAYGEKWAKYKKSYDVSCVVSGFRDGTGALKGLVGALLISVFKDGKFVEVGSVKPGSNDDHEKITDDRAAYFGKVVDVFAQELTVNGKLRHATFHRFRDDINPKDCTVEKLQKDFKKAARTDRKK